MIVNPLCHCARQDKTQGLAVLLQLSSIVDEASNSFLPMTCVIICVLGLLCPYIVCCTAQPPKCCHMLPFRRCWRL
jgi:hypothetical protein